MATEATLVEIMDEDKLLLKRSSRGVSTGKWNGVGGKLYEGEKPEENAVRETLEETGLTVSNLFYHGIMKFHNYGKEDVDFAVHLFSTKNFSGELRERSDDGGEVRWFKIDELPWNEMWGDDKHWLPHMLSGERFDADFYFDEGNKNILKHEIRVRS